MLEALKSGQVAAAGLDVYEDEPPAEASELRSQENLVLTPHLGASTQEAQENVGIDIARQIIDVLKGGLVVNALNMPSVDPQTLEHLAPHIHLSEKIGTFSQQLGLDSVEKIVVRYFGKLIELETLPLTNAVHRGFLREITDTVNDVNAPKKIADLGIETEEVRTQAHDNFNELIEVMINKDGKSRTIGGTLMGKQQTPRIVSLMGMQLKSIRTHT